MNEPQAQEKCPACGEVNCFDHALRTTQAQPREAELKPCPLVHPVKNGLHFRSSSGMRKWHITCFDCGLELEGNLDETARELFARWNTRADLSRATEGELSDDADALHFTICQAVTLMGQGDNHNALDVLRQCLVDFADKKKPLTRSEIVRQQQRSGGSEVTAVMISGADVTEEELTVEACLLQLRQMFGHGVYIMVDDRRIQYSEEIVRDPLRNARIHVDRNEFWANTLEETMLKVREWAKSRDKGEVSG